MLIPKRRGKLKSVQVTHRAHRMATEWAEKHGYQLASVVETAMEEFVARHAADPVSDAEFLSSPSSPPREEVLCCACSGDAPRFTFE